MISSYFNKNLCLCFVVSLQILLFTKKLLKQCVFVSFGDFEVLNKILNCDFVPVQKLFLFYRREAANFFEDIENTLYLDVFLIELFFCIVFLCFRTANDIVIGITVFRPGHTRGKAYKCWVGVGSNSLTSNSWTSNSFRIPAARRAQTRNT